MSRATVFRLRARYAEHLASVETRQSLERETRDSSRRARRLAREVAGLAALLQPCLETIESRHRAALLLTQNHGVSERRACELVGIHRSTARYRQDRGAPLGARIRRSPSSETPL
ncbi:MAG: hypothetical protein MJE66_17415 [Proteobacteria bacterium]|nr:hypothetical protein [Pseudomonadota bacterium]